MGDLVEEATVHHYKVGAHLVKRADVLGKVSKAQHQPGPPLSNARLDRFLDELEDLAEVEASIQSLRDSYAGLWRLQSQNSTPNDEAIVFQD